MRTNISKTYLVIGLLAISCLLLSATPSHKAKRNPVYARLEEVLNPANGDPNSSNVDYSQTVNLTVHFYSDDACTTPVALPFDVSFDISYTGYYYSIFVGLENLSGPFGSGSVSTGNTTAFFDDASWEGKLVNNGNIDEKYRQDYELASISGGVIIKPTLTASHSSGF